MSAVDSFVTNIFTLKTAKERDNESPNLFSLNAAVVEESGLDVKFEPLQQSGYQWGYTCLLIPRSPAHVLSNALQTRLTAAIQDVCSTNQWDVEFVFPELRYLQWAVRVPAAVPSSQIVQAVRSETSSVISREFPDHMNEIAWDDFWADGYLVVVGLHPHLPQTIECFINIARR